MPLPKELIESLKGIHGFDKEAMERVHNSSDRISSIRINPKKSGAGIFDDMEPVPWSNYGYYIKNRPSFTFDPRFHGGAYYVQEASGMFLEQAITQLVSFKENLKILDLCGAPGGKSTHIQSLITPESLLVSNEVIKSRASVLEENIIKWGASNVIVTNNDPADFGRVPGFFDVIVVDAPCSGSGLFRREPALIQEWSLNNVKLCCQRQQRILKDIIPSLSLGGILIYSTCSFSREENEDITDWLIEECGMESLPVLIEKDWGIVETISAKGGKGYRFFPDKIKGEGFYLSCFKNKAPVDSINRFSKPVKSKFISEKIKIPEEFILPEDVENLVSFGDRLLLQNKLMRESLSELQSTLYIKKAGVAVGKPSLKGLIPDHELALAGKTNEKVVDIPLNLEQSLQYLRKETFTLSAENKGWATVSYESVKLGWIKNLPGRFNNYYPTAWRILK